MAERRPCALMRLLTPKSVCVRLEDTGAFVLAELKKPLSPRSVVKAQRVHALAPVRAEVVLGAYNVVRHSFTECSLEADLPDAGYTRVGYAAKRKPDPLAVPGASDARQRHSGPEQGASCGSVQIPSE
jgi:hypothetical protein